MRALLFLPVFLWAVLTSYGALANEKATLTYFTETDNGVAWHWFDPDSKTSSILSEFPSKPDAIYWAGDFKTAAIAFDDKIMSYDFNSKSLVKKNQVSYPILKKREHVFGMWHDKQSQGLRVATYLPIPMDDVIETDKGLVTKWDGGEMLPLYTEIEWGSHAIFQVYEWQESPSKWNLIATEPSKTEAGDTPGASVLAPYWNEEAGFSENRLRADNYCASMFALYQGRVCHLFQEQEKLERKLLKQFFPNCPYEDLGMVRNTCAFDAIGAEKCVDCTYSLFHTSLQGDILNTATPFYLYDNKNETFKKLAIPDLKNFAQMSFKRIDNFVWLKDYSYDQPRLIVVDLNTGAIILDTEGTRPMWIGKYHEAVRF